jgi:hypothetical protein
MKLTYNALSRLVEAIRKEQKEITSMFACPTAAVDLKLNTRNRNKAIKDNLIAYGPLNLEDEKYWKKIAKHWNTSVGVAKKSTCGNCGAFDISPQMLDCMPGELEDDNGKLGYCWMHDFKCHSARSCKTWVAGGPIKTNKVSLSWLERQ